MTEQPKKRVRHGINPKTGRRWSYEAEQRELKAQDPAQIYKEIALLERQQKAIQARESLMTFVKFTSPDPEDPNDVSRSKYKNARHHDAVARALEEVVAGNIPFLILCMPPRHGKEIADTEDVLTPDGWRKHGDLRVGDFVFGIDGKPTRVLAVAEPNAQKVRVHFTNGQSVDCHPNHEWTVYDRSAGVWRTYDTATLMRRKLWIGEPNRRGSRATMQLPDARGVEFAERRLRLDPYVLGVWLGDGASGCGRIDMAASDEAVWRRIEASGMPISAISAHPQTGVVRVHFGCGKPGVLGPLTQALTDLGVFNDKYIPESYLRSSRAQRLQLLAGLMDTDGHVEARTGRCRVVTTNPKLRDGIVDLCTTLGFRPYVTQQAPTLSSSGVQGRLDVFTIGFQPHEPIPVSLPRRAVTRFATRRRVGVASITEAPDQPGRCIQVDASDGLYLVGRSLIPTHNSELVSRRLPAWLLGRFPNQHGVVATYSDDFAAEFGKEVRTIVNSPQFRQVFPDAKLMRGGAASDKLQTTQGGQWSFVGRGGGLTGRGAHILICDDLIKDDKEAQSQAVRDQAWNWFTKVAMSRRMGKKLVILTFTRWHNDDPIGRLTDPENPHYSPALAEKIKIINLPAIAEEDDPLGRKPGEPLWPDGPDTFDLDFLEEQRLLDPLGFAALYQQRPSLLDGDLFKRENIRIYRPDELPENLRVYGASDHAVATGQRNDFTVLGKIGVDSDMNIYILDLFWQRAKSDVAVEAMLDMTNGKHKPLLWWAERGHISKSIGPFLYKRMAERNAYMNVIEVTPIGDKAQRAQSIAGRVAMGKLYLPQDAPWREKAIAEMMAFPNGTHDDFVDMLSLIGLGLQSQFAPRGNSANKKPKAPEFGTLAWVKMHETWDRERRERLQAGGF